MAKKPSYLRAALLMPANLFALAAGGVASVVIGEPTPLFAAAGGSFLYLSLLSLAPGFRKMVRGNLEAQTDSEIASPEETERLLADLAPSQKEHYSALSGLKGRILENYQKLPGGRVLAASSERRIDKLLTAFLRLLSTLNAYRKYLNATDRRLLEQELAELKAESAAEANEKLREVKQRRVEILEQRVKRYAATEESRELVAHQLAGIEDLLQLTFEQSIAIRDPESVARQLEVLSSEVQATEETVRELEQFSMQITEISALPGSEIHEKDRVR